MSTIKIHLLASGLGMVAMAILFMAQLAHACGADDQQYIRHPNYNGAGNICYMRASGFFTTATFQDLDNNGAASACGSACDSYRTAGTIAANCEAAIVTLVVGNPSLSISNSWSCDLYTGSLRYYPLATGCPGSASTVFGIYRETINSCFAQSTAVASAFCNSRFPATAPTTTIYPSTVTVTPGASASDTITSTVTVTTLESSVRYSFLTATNTVTATETTTTSTIKVSAVVISTVVVSRIGKISTTLKATTPTVTATKTVCRGLRNIFARGVTPSPPPSCLNTGSISALPTPDSIISSGCNCLLTTVTLSVPDPTTAIATDTTTTTNTETVTETSTSIDATTSYTDVTVFTAVASSLTTVTETSTSTTYSTKVVTSTSLFTTYTGTATKITTAKTKTVTKEVVKTSIPTFALYARQVGTKAKYRLISRKLGGAENPDPEARTFQYNREAGNIPGVNATVIDGQLYIISQNANPKLYGVTMEIQQGANSGRIILGQQGSGKNSALNGCVVDSKMNVLTCKNKGNPAAWQELAWPDRDPAGRLILSLIPDGQSSNPKYKPVMELVVGEKGTVQVGC